MAGKTCQQLCFLLLVVTLVVDGRFSTRFLGEQPQEQQHQQSFQRLLVSPFHQRMANYDDVDDNDFPEQQPLRATANETADEGLFAAVGDERESWAGVVTPLATLSLLGAAAAMAANPILLTMAGLAERRRRRDAPPMHQIQVLEKYLSKVDDQETQQEKLMATYLSCSGFTSSSNFCLDRVICEYSIQTKRMDSLEKDVISIVLFNIMTNSHVSKEFKDRLRRAAKYGRSRSRCSQYRCDQLARK